ncbi:AzlC family ABC transporter permease [Halovenus marina]|jgi:4-azaleucine resistance transporter AzlC|uniref:AzlC family ABC transporter permease n=1 Tax=Halovenus marina TaxID=3396621 RepID=UPI003F5505E0
MKVLVDGLSVAENRSTFLAGVKDAIPVLTGLVPFGIILGITATELGFTTVEIATMSALVYSGAAQLAVMFLMEESALLALVLVTAVMISLRFAIYSASLAPKFHSYSRIRKAVYSFFLVDHLYALSISYFRDHDVERGHWYYFGAGSISWVAWVIGTAVGASIGVGVPDAFPVGLVLPLVFIALLFPVLEDRPSLATAAVAGSVAVVTAPLDYNLGLLLGVSCGLAVGVVLNR